MGKSRSRMLGADVDGMADPNYTPNATKTRDQMEGRADDAKKVDPEGLPGMDEGDEEDFSKKMFDDEIKEAEAAGDANLVKMCQLAMIKQLDSYKVDKKLCDGHGWLGRWVVGWLRSVGRLLAGTWDSRWVRGRPPHALRATAPVSAGSSSRR